MPFLWHGTLSQEAVRWWSRTDTGVGFSRPVVESDGRAILVGMALEICVNGQLQILQKSI